MTELSLPRTATSSVEDVFLLDVCRGIAAGSAGQLSRPPGGGAWVERARMHGILGIVLQALRRSGYELQPSEAAYRRATAMLRLTRYRDLAVLAGQLNRLGSSWVLVKGPVLAEAVYADPGVRDSSDLDILVEPRDLRRTVVELARDGVTVLGVDWTQRTWVRGSEIPMQMPSGTVVDLHWDLINRPAMRAAYDYPPQVVLDRRVRREVGGCVVWTPDDLDLVLHVLLHGCLDGCGRLRALLDAQQCIAWLGARGWAPSDLAARADERSLSAPAWMVLSAVVDRLDPSVHGWADAIGPTTHWVRWVRGRSRRPGRDAMSNGMTRRLYRYTTPRTISSVAGVAGYGVDRLRRVVSPDRTQVSPTPTNLDDVAFERYLGAVGR